MSRSRRIRVVWAIIAVCVFYVAGIFARWQYGALIIIRNASGHTVRDAAVKVERVGKKYDLGELAPGKQSRVFVEIAGESNVNLEFVDAQNQRHVATVIGYVEKGYCGRGNATILPSGDADSRDTTTLDPCWRSWRDFF